MSFTKTKIYNLALSALLLADQVSNADTDESNNINVLNTFWDIALESTLQDLDLDGLSEPITLLLLANLKDEADAAYDYDSPWDYVYKYPTNCALLRRLESNVATDNRYSHISKATGQFDSQKAIFTNQYQAIGKCIPKDVPLESFNAMAGMALAYKLAFLSAPLIVGKGAKALRKDIKEEYVFAKLESQETDKLENFNYEDEWTRSEFVAERLS